MARDWKSVVSDLVRLSEMISGQDFVDNEKVDAAIKEVLEAVAAAKAVIEDVKAKQAGE